MPTRARATFGFNLQQHLINLRDFSGVQTGDTLPLDPLATGDSQLAGEIGTLSHGNLVWHGNLLSLLSPDSVRVRTWSVRRAPCLKQVVS